MEGFVELGVQDGTPDHRCSIVRDHLHTLFPGQVVGLGKPHNGHHGQQTLRHWTFFLGIPQG